MILSLFTKRVLYRKPQNKSKKENAMMPTSSSKNSWYSPMKKSQNGAKNMISHFCHEYTDSQAMNRQRSSMLYSLKRKKINTWSSSLLQNELEYSNPLISENSSSRSLILLSSTDIAGFSSRRWQKLPTQILHLGILDWHSNTILILLLRFGDIQISRYTGSSRKKSEASSPQSVSHTIGHCWSV